MCGGGLAIINHKSIHHTSISLLIYSTFERIGSFVSLFTLSVKIFTLYPPPLSSIFTFCAKFESLLEHHITSNVDVIFIGDFNIHVDKKYDLNNAFF